MKWFTLSEMIHSATAVALKIWNGADLESERNLMSLIDCVLDPARERYGKAVHVSSGFRNKELNTVIHGASQSQHMRGEAADLTTDGGPYGNLELAKIIIALGHYDQVILENVSNTNLLPQWIHVSWRRNGQNRKEIRKKIVGSNQYPLVTRKEVFGV